MPENSSPCHDRTLPAAQNLISQRLIFQHVLQFLLPQGGMALETICTTFMPATADRELPIESRVPCVFFVYIGELGGTPEEADKVEHDSHIGTPPAELQLSKSRLSAGLGIFRSFLLS